MLRTAALGLLLLAVCARAAIPQEQFNAALAAIDMDQVLSSKRLVQNYVQCFTNKGPCPAQIAHIKRDFAEIMMTTCNICNKQQTLKIVYGLSQLKKLYPQEFRKLSEFWDPKGDYYRNFQAKAKRLKQQGHR